MEMSLSLLDNMYCGEKISRDRIPSHYKNKHQVRNLFRYAYPEGYRSTYTLVEFSEYGVCPVILDLMSHKEYESMFGYV